MPRSWAALGLMDDDRLAFPVDLPRVARVRAREDLHQGRLAGAVLPDQGVHLTLAHLQVDVVQRAHAGEALADAFQLEQDLAGALPSGTYRLCQDSLPIPDSSNCHFVRVFRGHRYAILAQLRRIGIASFSMQSTVRTTRSRSA